ncbi:hypothetical protein ABZ865_29645 [Streptomyces sp. NPDC047085]
MTQPDLEHFVATFRPSTPAGGGLRALCNPEAVGLDDEDGAEE